MVFTIHVDMTLEGAGMPSQGPFRKINRASDFRNGSVLAKYVWRRDFMSRSHHLGSSMSAEEGEKAGRTDSQLKWNSKETLGRKLGEGRNLALSGKKVQNGPRLT